MSTFSSENTIQSNQSGAPKSDDSADLGKRPTPRAWKISALPHRRFSPVFTFGVSSHQEKWLPNRLRSKVLPHRLDLAIRSLHPPPIQPRGKRNRATEQTRAQSGIVTFLSHGMIYGLTPSDIIPRVRSPLLPPDSALYSGLNRGSPYGIWHGIRPHGLA